MPIPTISVLHAIQEQFNRFSFILVHDLDFISLQLEPQKAGKSKIMERTDFLPFTNSMRVSQFKFHSMGSRKKIAGVRFCHLFQKSSAKVLVMHQNKEKKINGMTMHFSSRATLIEIA